MTSFSSLEVQQDIIDVLERQNIVSPTPVQAAVLPSALAGKDVLASADTGTGKTLAFLIPCIEKIRNNNESTALIITPTRELAAQIHAALAKINQRAWNIRTALLIGGAPMRAQFKQLDSTPQIIIGTPGRINDHLSRKSLKLGNCQTLVLDETDRMLDMGFSIQIESIVEAITSERQTLLLSATMPPSIRKIAGKYLKNPEFIAIEPSKTLTTNLKQHVVRVKRDEKYEALKKELDEREGSIIVFVQTKSLAHSLALQLKKDRFKADSIHGDLRHSARERRVQGFRNQRYRILVATDIVARGLDIPHIEHVINFDLALCPEDHVHRIGRTARAGAKGEAVSFVTPQDGAKWRAIEHVLDPSLRDKEPARVSRTPRRSFGGNGNSRGRSFGDRGNSSGNRGRSFGDRGRSSFGDKEKSYGDKGRSFGDRSRPSFGDKEKSYGDRDRSFGDRSRPSFGDKEKSYGDKGRSFGDRSRPSFGDKEKSYGDRDRSFGDRKKSFGDKGRSFGDKNKSFNSRSSGFNKGPRQAKP